ncbi:hypothetical protein GCM10022377_07480 [Zhihengliuella alba]|uniref:Putative zinc-finger domain-containing protein n=1 Tax=Zhihengliuella alba TaxID=547018 RepID=A0ABP7CVF8_9MICC
MHRTERLLEPYIAGELPTRRSHKVENHLSECADCRLELATLRRRRLRAERLRHAAARSVPGFGVAGPPAALVAGASEQRGRREGGAAVIPGRAPHRPDPADAAPSAGDRARWTRPLGTDHAGGQPRRRRVALPMLGLTLLCSLIAVLAAAWTVGGAPGPAAADAAASGGEGALWGEEGTELDPATVVRLQNSGWNLPDLSAMDYRPVRALGFAVDGQPRVELTYEGPAGTIALVERRKEEAETTASDPSVAADASRLAADAAEPLEGGEPGGAGLDEAAAPSFGLHGVLVQHAVAPVSPTARRLEGESSSIDTPDAVYTLTVPDGGPREAVLNRVVLTEYSQLDHAPAAEDDALSRLARGFARMGLLDALR